LQPTRTAAFLCSKLRYHRVAVRAAEPVTVGRRTEASNMASADVEAKVFAQFKDQTPEFAGAPVTCSPGPNPPDFICVDETGYRIGVELSEWLDEDQIARERPQYRRESEFLEAINSREVSPPKHIGNICIFETEGLRLHANEAADFRKQLYAFISNLDDRWESMEDHDDPQGADIHDFDGYPLLQKYLAAMNCRSQRWFETHDGNEWIVFMNHGGAYSPESAVNALKVTLARKTQKYATLHDDQRLTKLFLLIYYDQGFHYNTPFDAPGYGFDEIAVELAALAAIDHGVFEGIWLFIPATGDIAKLY
jgi:hypothetical protein